MLRIGIDTGGTFTDFVVWEEGRLRILKLPSTPSQPEAAILQGLQQILEEGAPFQIGHGSTVATNALLERKGARTVLVTNQGFEDLLEIGRQDRPGLYRLGPSRPEALVPRALRLGVRERTLADGSLLLALDQRTLDRLRNRVASLRPEVVAVCLLHSYRNPESEERIARHLASLEIPLSLSHRVLPVFREYERTSATVINAYVTPVMSRYLGALSQHPLLRDGELSIMQSNGGRISAQAAQEVPIRTLLSGPAGGVVGAFEVARRAGFQKIITFDMGGTSTDVCLCDGGVPLTSETALAHQPVPVEMINIQTVGAGGGSIAWIDPGGLLRVGPQSAGAEPGPVCYGRGEQMTVTDAHIFLGRLDPDYFLGGELPLQPERIHPVLEELTRRLNLSGGRLWSLAEVAEGIVRIANTHMEGAIRLISLQRGYDTREFTLVAFGGAGGLHACELARSLLIPRVLVPAHPGLLSAFGILQAPVVRDAVQTVLLPSSLPELEGRLTADFQALEGRVREELSREGFPPHSQRLQKKLDVRYAGQAYELTVPFVPDWPERFHRRHEQFYGYCNPRLPLEIVNLRVRGEAGQELPPPQPLPEGKESPPPEALLQEKQVQFEGQLLPTRFYLRKKLQPGNRLPGPAVILEYSSTVLVPPDFQARVDGWTNLLLEPSG